jgi:tripartite-type tricarboxylate transporter receptor subunit TctC
MMRKGTFIGALALGLASLAGPDGAVAQDFPSKPVRVSVAYPAGGLADVLTRAITQELNRMWKTPVLVENKLGASGVIASEYVFRSPPDGYTILLTDNGIWFGNEFLRPSKLAYDLNKDFVPVIGVVVTHHILVARNGLPVNNVKELIELAKERKGQLRYFSLGVGSLQHVDMEAFLREAGVSAVHVPYAGGNPAMHAIQGDEVDFGFNGISGAASLVQEGKVKGLAVTSDKRQHFLPNVPTLSESAGFPFLSRAWFVFMVPAQTPEAVIRKLRTDIQQVLTNEDFRKKYLEPNGWEAFAVYGDQLRAFIDADRKQYEARLKPLNLKLE